MGIVRNIKRRFSRTYANAISAVGLNVKGAPYIWPVSYAGGIRWQMGDFRTYATEGFNSNSIIYSAIMYKVRAVTQAPLRAVKYIDGQTEFLPDTHPLTQLMHKPNPQMSWLDVQGLLTACLNLAGNAYLFVDREGSKNGTPRALWPIRPDEIYLIPERTEIKGYLYVPSGTSIADGIPILVEDMVHVKFPNPMDPYNGLGYGLSPMAPISQSGDIDNSVSKFLKLFFDRGAQPAGLLKFNHPLETGQVEAIKQKWRELYGGIDNWTDVGVIDNGGDYKPLAYNFNEMGFDVLDSRNESRVIGPFGVPPILLGTRFGLANATYSNYEEARKAFWEDTMTYELRLSEIAIASRVSSKDGATVIHDTSSVPALRSNILKLVDGVKKLWDMGVPAGDAFTTMGLHVPDYEGNDISWIPSTVRDARTPATPTPAKRSRPAATDDEVHRGDKLTQEIAELKKGVQAGQVRDIMESWDGDFEEAAAKRFHADAKALLKIVKEHAAKATIDWTPIVDPYDDYLAHAGADGWRDVFVPLRAGLIKDAGAFWSTELGTTFSLRNLEGEKWFADYTLQFAQPINSTTSDMVHDMIAQAMEEGWSNQALQNHISAVFDVWAGDSSMPADVSDWLKTRGVANRAELIARTETTRAANAGSQELFKRFGAIGKEWAASIDGRERDTHAAANGLKVEPDNFFLVGGYKMSYPGDMGNGAPIKEVANCRCALLPIVPPEKAANATTTPFNPKLFPNDDAYWDYMEEWRADIEAMDDDARRALVNYTGQSYIEINNALRNNSIDSLRRMDQETLIRLRDYFNGPPPPMGLKDDLVVYRGTSAAIFGINPPPRGRLDPNDVAGQLQSVVGTFVRDPAFLSTSVSSQVAENFSKGVIFRIDAPKGTPGVYIASHSNVRGEYEVVMPHNTAIEITAVKVEGKNVIIEGRYAAA